MKETNYIEINKIIAIIEKKVQKGEISRKTADNIIDEINDEVNTRKYKTINWKFGKE